MSCLSGAKHSKHILNCGQWWSTKKKCLRRRQDVLTSESSGFQSSRHQSRLKLRFTTRFEQTRLHVTLNSFVLFEVQNLFASVLGFAILPESLPSKVASRKEMTEESKSDVTLNELRELIVSRDGQIAKLQAQLDRMESRLVEIQDKLGASRPQPRADEALFTRRDEERRPVAREDEARLEREREADRLLRERQAAERAAQQREAERRAAEARAEALRLAKEREEAARQERLRKEAEARKKAEEAQRKREELDKHRHAILGDLLDDTDAPAGSDSLFGGSKDKRPSAGLFD